MLNLRVVCVSAICAALTGTLAWAADYPVAPVRIIYPATVGSSGDVRIRQVAELLSQRMKARFIVENKPGASASIGASYVARAAPDGYTLLAVFTSFVSAPALLKNPGYHPIQDFSPVANLTVASPVLVVDPSLPVRSLRDFIEMAKRNPDGVSLANSGMGTVTHLPAVMFEQEAGIKVVHVPYKGESQAIPDIIGGQVQGMFAYATIALPQIRAGKLRALAVPRSTRNPALPDVPTFAEAGLPGVEYQSWLGIVAPRGTPQSIIGALHREIGAIMNSPEIKSQAESIGSQVYTPPLPEISAMLKADFERHTKLIQKLGLVLE